MDSTITVVRSNCPSISPKNRQKRQAHKVGKYSENYITRIFGLEFLENLPEDYVWMIEGIRQPDGQINHTWYSNSDFHKHFEEYKEK